MSMIERLFYRSRRPKFKRRPRRLVWRTPKPIRTTDKDQNATSLIVPTVSPRRWRHLGRREVYPHSMHLHMMPYHRIERR